MIPYAIAFLVVVAVAGTYFGGRWYLARENTSSVTGAPSPGSPAGATSPTGTSSPSDTSPASPTPTDSSAQPSTPSPSAGPSPSEVQALRELNQLADAGLASVGLDNRWVPQLASKYVGVPDPWQTAANGTHTFNATDILAEFHQLRRTVGGAARLVMLRSTDYGRHQRVHGKEIWVTFAIASFSGKRDVQRWCAQRFPRLSGAALEDRCLPRRLAPPR